MRCGLCSHGTSPGHWVSCWPVSIFEQIIFWIYLVIGPVAWALFIVGMLGGWRQMRLLKKPYAPLPDPSPLATIIVPAKDEVARIADCVNSALQQDFPSFQVVVIDDRSTDGTGEKLDAMAAADPHLHVQHIREGGPPPGWTGKCNALHQGISRIGPAGPHGNGWGQWLVFVDSDVVLQPDALRAMIGRANRQGYDLLSLMPSLEAHGFWERLIMPVAGGIFSMSHLVSLTNKDYMRNVAIANGQVLMVRESTYRQMDGHQAVRSAFCEDIALARLYKSSGKRIRIAEGAHLAAVRMYSSLAGIFRGWTRLFYSGGGGKMWRIIGTLLFLLIGSYSLLPAAWRAIYWVEHGSILPFQQHWAWLWASAAHLGFMLAAMMLMYHWSRNHMRWAILFPLTLALVIWTLLRAIWLCHTRTLTWRGTRYVGDTAVNPADHT